MKWSLGAQGSLEWPWGSPDRLQGSPEGAQGFPGEVPRAAQGIPIELGFPEARDPLAGWMAGLWLGSNERADGLLKTCLGSCAGIMSNPVRTL